MKRRALCAYFCAAWLVGAVAKADDLTGEVYAAGSDLHMETRLSIDKTEAGIRLCPSDTEDRIRRLTQLTVKVSGLWQLLKGGVKDCFAVSTFTVVRMSSGREAAVGKLSVRDGGYVLTADDGSQQRLADVTPHLRQRLEEKLILDLKTMANPAVRGPNKVVVSFRVYP